MDPIEFTFKGPPLSHQSKSKTRKRAYVATVQTRARTSLPDNFVVEAGPVKVAITYYYEGQTGDVDNIIKPIQDAMNAIVYHDDEQVMETSSRKLDINGSYRVRHTSLCIVQALSEGDEFIHVKVENYVADQNL